MPADIHFLYLLFCCNRFPSDGFSYAHNGAAYGNHIVLGELYRGVSADAAGRVIDFALPMLLLWIILEIPHDYHFVAWFVAELLVRILGVEIDVPVLVIHVLAPIIQELIGAVSLLVAANFRLFTIVINKIIADDSISRIVAGLLSGKPGCAHEQHEKRAQGNDDFLFHTINIISTQNPLIWYEFRTNCKSYAKLGKRNIIPL